MVGSILQQFPVIPRESLRLYKFCKQHYFKNLFADRECKQHASIDYS